MAVVRVPTAQISDWETFHDVFAEVLGFPGFYGRNMDAFIDCLTYADEDDGMRNITVAPGEVLVLDLEDAEDFAARCPEQYAALVECLNAVNRLRTETGDQPVLAISAP